MRGEPDGLGTVLQPGRVSLQGNPGLGDSTGSLAAFSIPALSKIMVHTLNAQGKIAGGEASLDFGDPAIQFGAAGAFETMRVEAGRVHCYAAHRKRLAAALEFLRLRWDLGEEKLLELMAREVGRFPSGAGLRLRLTVGAEHGQDAAMPGAGEAKLSRAFAEARPLDPACEGPVGARPAMALCTFEDYRIASMDPWRGFKTTHYYPQYEARRRALRRGFDEALLLNERGEAVEATAHNLFWIKDGVLFFPPASTGALPGTFGDYLVERARSRGQETQQAAARPTEVQSAEAVFLTNAIGELRSVTRWDARTYEPLASTRAGRSLLGLVEEEREGRGDLDLRGAG